MPAANPPPARASATTMPMTICAGFMSVVPFLTGARGSLVAECLAGMQPRCAHRGVAPEADADRNGADDRDDHGAGGADEEGPACCRDERHGTGIQRRDPREQPDT